MNRKGILNSITAFNNDLYHRLSLISAINLIAAAVKADLMIKQKAGWILLQYVLKDSLLAVTALIAGWRTPLGRPDVTGHGSR